MTKQELELLKAANKNSSAFGTVTEIIYWPSVTLAYSLDGLAPTLYGNRSVVTVSTVEGAEPELGGVIPTGGVNLSSADVAALDGWVTFETALKTMLEERWQAQHAAAAVENQPPPPLPE